MAWRLPEGSKSAGPDGEPCGRETRGLLQRRHVKPDGYIRQIEKEAHQLEEREAGLAHDPAEAPIEYEHPEHDHYRSVVVPILRELTVAEIARETGLSERTVKRARAGRSNPRRTTVATLVEYAAKQSGTHKAPPTESGCT